MCIHLFHPPAVRSATFGSWRMLTLGAEYEDTWAPSPDKKRRVQQVEGEQEEADTGEPEEPLWKATNTDTGQKFDTVLHLDGSSWAGRRNGVRQMVKKHQTLNNTLWPRRSDTQPSNSH